MSIFAEIIEVYSFEKVTFYSLKTEGEDATMFFEFVQRISKDVGLVKDLNVILKWLQNMGKKYGAREQYFRFENRVSALPPPIRFLETESKLRLYCMRLSENAVILFSGAVKTARTAQECPNVRPYFNQANNLSIKIDEAIREKRIQVNHESGRLMIENGFVLEL